MSQSHDAVPNSEMTRRGALLAAAAVAMAAKAPAHAQPQPVRPPDIVMMDALTLSAAIRARRVSCREVMQAYLGHIARTNPPVNAIVSMVDADRLMAQAAARDEQLVRGQWMGWMHGFPHAVKDLANTQGIRTTSGSPIFRDHVPDHDAIIVERMRAAGAIIIGKTNVPEFGLGSNSYNPVFGVTGNAWDPAMNAGGSSGGAAVAAALRMVPVADGSDYFGSLRNPAGWANIVGMRPSQGRVPFGPVDENFVLQQPTEGPMGRTVAETAILLSTLAGPDARVPLSISEDPRVFAGSLDRDMRGVRVGWLASVVDSMPFEPGMVELCRASMRVFEGMGCQVAEARLNVPREQIFDSFVTLRNFVFAGASAPLLADPATRALMKPEAVWEGESGLSLTGVQAFAGSVARSAVYQAINRLQQDFDILVLPTAQVFTFDKTIHWPRQVGGVQMDTYHRWMEVCALASLCGLPAASMPAGFDPRGNPVGIQLMGRWRDDIGVLQVARAYEQATDWVSRTAPMLRGA